MDGFIPIDPQSLVDTAAAGLETELSAAAFSSALYNIPSDSIDDNQLPVDFEVRGPGGATWFCIIA